MNEQIFDWAENSEKVLRTGQYSTFHSRFREQVALIRYLLVQGHNKERIYELWKSTNPHEIQYADDEQEKREVFGRAWRKAQKWRNIFRSPITIYKEEIDFINKMSVILWIKQYVLAMLCVYKYYRQTWCGYTNRIKCFCYSQTYVQNEREEYTLKMCDCLREYSPYTTVIHEGNVAFKMNFAQVLGTPLATIKNPSEVSELFQYLEDSRVCPRCGRRFSGNFAQLRRDICDDCFKEEKRKKNSLKCKKYYEKKKIHTTPIQISDIMNKRTLLLQENKGEEPNGN